MPLLGTRAIIRLTPPGTDAECPGCGEIVKFVAKKKRNEVIANVYGRDGDLSAWDRVEHWHADCYEEAGQPHGVPVQRELRTGTFKHVLNQ
jgi:hypothetical protein